MIEPYPDIGYRPVCLVLWNDPAPVPVVFEDGDILVSLENIRGTLGDWGWRYIILRRVKEEAEGESKN